MIKACGPLVLWRDLRCPRMLITRWLAAPAGEVVGTVVWRRVARFWGLPRVINVAGPLRSSRDLGRPQVLIIRRGRQGLGWFSMTRQTVRRRCFRSSVLAALSTRVRPSLRTDVCRCTSTKWSTWVADADPRSKWGDSVTRPQTWAWGRWMTNVRRGGRPPSPDEAADMATAMKAGMESLDDDWAAGWPAVADEAAHMAAAVIAGMGSLDDDRAGVGADADEAAPLGTAMMPGGGVSDDDRAAGSGRGRR